MTEHLCERPILFTAIVVTYNEAGRLRECLASLSFCDQLIVADLGSKDESPDIAKDFDAELLHLERQPVVEQVRGQVIKYARHDWLILIDPDEVIPSELARQIEHAIVKHTEAGVIKVPWQFYFKGKPLRTCIWGYGNNTKAISVHRGRVRFTPSVHRGLKKVKSDVKIVEIPRRGSNYIRHYWADSYRELVEKHLRYIRQEGQAKHESGERFSWSSTLFESVKALKANLINYRGLAGGVTGVSLSCFYCWYVFMSWMSLRKFENNRMRSHG